MTDRPRLSLAPVRAAIQKRVDETNLRDTAKEIGIAHSALSRILEGKTKRPQRTTLNRLHRWYYRDKARQSVQNDDVEIAASVISAWAGGLSSAVQERELENKFDQIRKAAKLRE